MDPLAFEFLMTTLELTGTTFSELAMKWLVTELSKYPPANVIDALDRCRKEVKGKLTSADIFSRYPGGNPSYRPTSVVL